ncbi:hypothetical protein ACFQ1E_05585 [Sphingomonas canadensis]|uniref:General secretion pathway protein GspN n=1 Tax=Sphingomonas canadensis TaxID=1219257 RepID=A0ABW3H345_9SPHN|nr:hypothetical protein [Sphingomonas canadensis]MCW3835740.1 hypothetical protein [Sphingomonas canadensis]
MITRREMAALGAAGLAAVAMPVLLLLPGAGGAPAKAPAAPAGPLTVTAGPELALVYQRPLFAGAPAGEGAAGEAPADAPALVGIAGRLDQDAVAMVRTADGSTRNLAVGESVDGWKLESLAIDAAFFTRGSERVRVALPEGE